MTRQGTRCTPRRTFSGSAPPSTPGSRAPTASSVHEDQVRVCTDFVEREGGVVREDLIFVDRAISGSSLSRAGFEQMMTLGARAPASRRRDRLRRLVAHHTATSPTERRLFKRLQFAGVPLIGIADNIDTANPSSKMSYGLKALMSEAYINDLRFVKARARWSRPEGLLDGRPSDRLPQRTRSWRRWHGRRSPHRRRRKGQGDRDADLLDVQPGAVVRVDRALAQR